MSFENTRTALAAYQAKVPELEAMFNRIQTNDDLKAWQSAQEEARLLVCDAFYEDTQHINSRDNCRLLGVGEIVNLLRDIDRRT